MECGLPCDLPITCIYGKMYFVCRYEGRTALYWAVMCHDLETLDLLLSEILWILEDTGQRELIPIPLETSLAIQSRSYYPDSDRKPGCFPFCGLG